MLRMGCVAVSNVVPFRRAVPIQAPGEREARHRRRSEQRSLLDAVYATGSLIIAAEDRAMKLTAERARVIAEGAAGCAIAAAISGRGGISSGGKIVAVVSGGNIDLAKFAQVVGACSAS